VGDRKKNTFFGHLDKAKSDHERRCAVMSLATEIKTFDLPSEVGQGQRKAFASMLQKFAASEKIDQKIRTSMEYKSAFESLKH